MVGVVLLVVKRFTLVGTAVICRAFTVVMVDTTLPAALVTLTVTDQVSASSALASGIARLHVCNATL